jgi:hypothetical protein
MTWHAREIPELRGYTVEWAEQGSYILSRQNRLFLSPDLRPPFSPLTKIDAPAWRKVAAKFRLGQRLLRFMVTNVLPLANGDLFVTFDRAVGIVRRGRYTPLPGLVRPCRVLRGAAAVDGSGDVFFGEYLANAEHGEMRVYRFDAAAGRLEPVHVFAPGTIRHVHGLYHDPATNAIYCLTGDNAAECRMLRSTDGCRSFETVGAGDESWRAVSMLFDDDSIYYGTDAEFRENQIYQLDRQTSERSVMGEVSGTVFYSKRMGDDLFFTTTAEAAPSQKENVAAVWHIGPHGTLTEVARFAKDRWHKGLFMFGTIHFPNMARGHDRLFFHLVGVEGDNRTFELINHS